MATRLVAVPRGIRIAPPLQTETLRCLFLRHPSLVAFVNGHEHRNLVEPIARPPEADLPGGFWQITTASHIHWPQQSRLFDLIDNGDGTLSIVTTILDHSGSDLPAAGEVGRLAAIAHEIAFNDPQAATAVTGSATRRARLLVELMVPIPRRRRRRLRAKRSDPAVTGGSVPSRWGRPVTPRRLLVVRRCSTALSDLL